MVNDGRSQSIAGAALTNNPVKAYVLKRANIGKQLISEGRPFEKDILEVFSEPEQPLPESGLYQVFTPNELVSVFTVISGDTIGHRLLKFNFTPRTDGNLRTNYIPSSDW